MSKQSSILNYVTVQKSDSTQSKKRKQFEDDAISGDSTEPSRKKAKLTAALNEDDCKQSLCFKDCFSLLDKDWAKRLSKFFNTSDFQNLRANLLKEEASGHEIFPPVKEVFCAFSLCSFADLKVVLLGQDPYHDNGQAEGLCFSVKKGIRVPCSLRNMYKECEDDVQVFKRPSHGSLVDWGKQGVLLLNTVLTVRAHCANSHKDFGWQKFTDYVIDFINKNHDGCVFILWGKQAQKKEKVIDVKKHRIISSAHPSGLSASRGFFGSKPYSKTNKFLQDLGKKPIDWTIKE